jgi:hypothetical protein
VALIDRKPVTSKWRNSHFGVFAFPEPTNLSLFNECCFFPLAIETMRRPSCGLGMCYLFTYESKVTSVATVGESLITGAKMTGSYRG